MNDDLYKKNLVCPMCGKSFDSSKVRYDKIRPQKADTDLFKYFYGSNPYFYEINICPHCGFSYTDNYDKLISSVQKQTFQNRISKQWRSKDYGNERAIDQAIESFKLALLSAQTIDMKPSISGGICHRIGCLNRVIGNTSEESRFLTAAVSFYSSAYSSEELGIPNSVKPEIVVYLLGELNFRIERYNESAKWFELAVTKYCGNPDVKKGISDMIRNRWFDVKEQISKNIHTTA